MQRVHYNIQVHKYISSLLLVNRVTNDFVTLALAFDLPKYYDTNIIAISHLDTIDLTPDLVHYCVTPAILMVNYPLHSTR